MGPTHIRPAEDGDLIEVQAIARRTVDACYRPLLGDASVDWYLDSGECDKELAGHVAEMHVMTEGAAIVAFTILLDDSVHLMMVDVTRHRQGIGSRLLRYAEQRLFAEHGRIRLNTFDGNEQAISFYRKNGWRETHSETDAEHGFVRRFFEKRAGQGDGAA